VNKDAFSISNVEVFARRSVENSSPLLESCSSKLSDHHTVDTLSVKEATCLKSVNASVGLFSLRTAKKHSPNNATTKSVQAKIFLTLKFFIYSMLPHN